MTSLLALVLLAQASPSRAPSEALIAEAAGLNRLGAISLAISSGGQPDVRFHQGQAKADAVYRAGSLTMPVTALAIARLVSEGKIRLDAPVRKYLKHFPDQKPAITVRHLVLHQSGLTREPRIGHSFAPSAATLRQITTSLKESALAFPPGSGTKYSNAGYAVLGDLIEEVTRQPYSVYVQREVLTPLGMSASTFEAPASVLAGRLWTIEGREFPAPTWAPAMLPALGLYTTADDLLKLGRHLLSRQAPKFMRKSGLGVHASEYFGHSAVLRIDRTRNTVAAALTPKDGMASMLIALLDGKSQEVTHGNVTDEFRLNAYPTVPPPPSEPWAKHIGEYGWDSHRFYFHEREGKPYLLASWFHLEKLSPLGENRFRFSDTGYFAGETLTLLPDGLLIGPVFVPKIPGPLGDFRIAMLKPLAELRRIAATSEPPAQDGNLKQPDLVDLKRLSPSFRFDIRYATPKNFMGAALYSHNAAWLQRPAAEALLRVSERVKAQGYGLLIHDAYRPWRVTKMFWEATPVSQRNFVANPATGSRHNRGCAVDLSLYDRKTGEPVEMVSGFDEFTDRAYPEYPGGTMRQRWFRNLLRSAMESEGFTVNSDEWWHFDHKTWRDYPVMNISFEELEKR
jgi:D-alanyl-D-alanine dipeptidase/CubicO group peptidase (beta-lactamase class C family)